MWNHKKGKKCNKQKPQTPQKQAPRRLNWVDEESDNQEEEEKEEEQYVLGLDDGGSPPFMMKSKINRKKFCLMIDSGSPVTIIIEDEVQKYITT